MSTQIRHDCRILILGLIALTLAPACTGRRVSTAVEDQTFQPGPTAPPLVEAAKVAPPAAAPPEPPARIEAPPTEAPPPTPPAGEVHVTEQPVAPASQPKPAVPPALPAAELSDIYFDFDQYGLRGDARPGLEANARILKSQSNDKFVIEGHCDERGTSATTSFSASGAHRPPNGTYRIWASGHLKSRSLVMGKSVPFAQSIAKTAGSQTAAPTFAVPRRQGENRRQSQLPDERVNRWRMT